MPTHVALLRGINLGPHKRVAMPALRTLVASLGHSDVATYIASGNVVFTAGDPKAPLAADLEKAIAAELGVGCRVVVRTCAEIAATVAKNPYPDQPDPKRVHAVFLVEKPTAAAHEHVATLVEKCAAKGSNDEATIVGSVLYLHTPDGFGRSDLAVELTKDVKRNPAVGTARNWATVLKLAAMCEGG